jgi:protein TonB
MRTGSREHALRASSNRSTLGDLLAEIREEALERATARRRTERQTVRTDGWVVREDDSLAGHCSTSSPLGALLGDIRERAVRRAQASSPPPRSSGGRQLPECDFCPETGVVSGPSPRTSRAKWLLPASFLLHVAALAALIVLPLLATERPPVPRLGTRAFLVEPVLAPPPPPPPPAPPSTPVLTPRRLARPAPAKPPALMAPVETPETIATPETLDIGAHAAGPEGSGGGVPGGIPGGVVGGVVGGLTPSPPPPKPIRIGEGGLQEPRKLRHVGPIYPDIALRANVRGRILLECTISPQGRVAAVKVVRGVPLLDEAAIAAVRQWLFTPSLVNGVPVPVIMMVTVEFRLE